METACAFGPDESLVGILTPGAEGAPPIVIPNAYVTPHIGLFRMHVEMARAFAEDGFPVLRFDVSGIGDSVGGGEQRPYAERMQADLSSAIDWVCEERDVDRVILLGHCDGASNAFFVAAEDERVRGLACIDGLMAPSWRYKMQQLGRKLVWPLRPQAWAGRWRRLRTGEAASALSLRGLAGPEATMYTGRRAAERLSAGLAALRERDVPSLWAFSGDYLKYGTFGEIRDALDRDGGAPAADRLVLRDARHVYPEAYNRRALIDELRAWLARRFGSHRPTSAGRA